MATSLTRCVCGYCCGCAGVVAGGGFGVGAGGGGRGRTYHTRARAKTNAPAAVNNLFLSIGSAHSSLCRITLAPLAALGQVKPSGQRSTTWLCGQECARARLEV